MTKAMFCIECTDIIAPYSNTNYGALRWCQCGATAARWLTREGKLEVVRSNPAMRWPFVIGLDNAFLTYGVRNKMMAEGWRDLHERTTREVPDNYLFHRERRDCWALLVRQGESGDVTYTEQADVDATT